MRRMSNSSGLSRLPREPDQAMLQEAYDQGVRDAQERANRQAQERINSAMQRRRGYKHLRTEKIPRRRTMRRQWGD